MKNYSSYKIFKIKLLQGNNMSFFKNILLICLTFIIIIPNSYSHKKSCNTLVKEGRFFVLGSTMESYFLKTYLEANTPTPGTPDGQWIEINEANKKMAVSNYNDNSVKIYDINLDTPNEIAVVTTPNDIAEKISFNNEYLIVPQYQPGYLAVYDTETLTLQPAITSPPTTITVRSTDISPDGTKLLLGRAIDPVIKMYDITTIPFTELPDLEHTTYSDVMTVNYNHSGTQFAIGTRGTTGPNLHIYDSSTGTVVQSISHSNSTTAMVEWSLDDKYLYVMGYGTDSVKVYNTDTWDAIDPPIGGYPDGAGQAKWDVDRLFVVHEDSVPAVRVYDTAVVPFVIIQDITNGMPGFPYLIGITY